MPLPITNGLHEYPLPREAFSLYYVWKEFAQMFCIATKKINVLNAVVNTFAVT